MPHPHHRKHHHLHRDNPRSHGRKRRVKPGTEYESDTTTHREGGDAHQSSLDEYAINRFKPKGEEQTFKIERIRQDSAALLYNQGKNKTEDFAKAFLHSFRPALYLMIACGRFPFTFIPKKDKTYNCKAVFYHPRFIYFCLTFLAFFFIFGMSLFHYYRISFIEPFDGLKDRRVRTARFYEAIVTERYFVCLWFIYGGFIQLVFETIFIFKRIKLIEDYFSMYTRAVTLLRMSVGDGINRFILKSLIFFSISTFGFMVLFFFKLGPTSCGFPTMTSVLLFSEYDREMFLPPKPEPFGPNLKFYRIVGTVFLVILWILPKLWIFLYILHCKFLVNIYGTYNARTYLCVLKGGKYMDTNKGFLTLRALYLDHLIILDMVEGCDRIFSYIIEFYYTCTIINLIATGFLLFRSIFENEYPTLKEEPVNAYFQLKFKLFFIFLAQNYFPRTRDFIPNLCLFIFDLIILIAMTVYPTQVLNESSAGMDIVRRAGAFRRRKSYTLLFQLSLFCNIMKGRVLGMIVGDIMDFGIFEFGSLFITFWNYIMTIYEFWPRFAALIPEDFTRDEMRQVIEELESFNRSIFSS